MGIDLEQSNTEFPISGLLPRKETGVINFLNKNSAYDGRGTIIAIFDSGVDPSAPGLQVTTENQVKVIDRIDASGAGDVDTSTVVECESGGKVNGLTGRTLQIPSGWSNPTKKFHLGVFSLYNLYPSKLRERVIKERKEKEWDSLHRTFLSKAQRRAQFFEDNPHGNHTNESGVTNTSSSKISLEDDETSTPDSKGEADEKVPLSFTEKLQKEDALAEVSVLKSLDKKYNDVGPSYDVVVFHDGICWRACIDSSECGELNKGILLGEYRVTHDFKIVNKTDQYTVSINVHNDGDILEIVGMCSSHGTHVASIAAAYFPESPEKNGVAPGAKIVSITIGDNRIGTMETGTAMVRAMSRVMENPYYKVDVINMSYGENAHWSNAGRLGEIAHEVVNKYGVIWVSSAGNHGPALNTVGVPPDFFSDSIIGVGAFVSPEMMLAEYSLTDMLPGRPYTWSSRGPTGDGGRGVSVCAPGGAITSVPKFTLRCNQMMNGTSMASPHTAGCVALLVSAVKQKKLPYTPYSIRRAIQNTAHSLPTDIFAQGHGLLNVEKSLDYLVEFSHSLETNIRFAVECGSERGKGIYLRNWRADKSVEIPVSVEPFLFDGTRADPADKLSLNFEFVLTCDDSWVKFPSFLQMSYTSRAFKVILDPSGLEPGRVFFSCIKGYLANEPQKGPLFEVPITMIVPLIDLKNGCQYELPMRPLQSGEVLRRFIRVPEEACIATLVIRSGMCDKVQRFTLHAVQMKPLCSVVTYEFEKILNLGQNESARHSFNVKGGLVLEICVARWWSCLAKGDFELKVDFHGLLSSQDPVCFATGDSVHRFDITAGLRAEDVLPQASIKQHCQVLQPTESKIEVLGGERDTLPEDKIIYQIVLTYNFSVAKSGVEVIPKCALLNSVLYESAFESQLWMLFDSNKQLLCSGDAFYRNYNVKLEKGAYVVRMHIRHDKVDLLEKLSDTPLQILTKLSQEVKVDIYPSYSSAVTNGKKISSQNVSRGSSIALYVTPPNICDKNLKWLPVSVGDLLVGSISLSKEESVKKAEFLPLKIFVTDFPSKKKSSSSVSGDDKKDSKTFADYEESLKDFKTSWISKLDKDTGERLFDEMTSTYPDHLTALLHRVHVLDAASGNHTEQIVSLCEKIIAGVDVEALLAFYGTKTDSRKDAGKIKLQMDRQRNTLLEAWSRLGNAIYRSMVGNGEIGAKSADDTTLLDSIAADIMRFVDPTDSKVVQFFINYYQLKGFKALACRLLSKIHDEKPTKDTDSQLSRLYADLDWTHAARFASSARSTKFPPSYTRF